MLKEIYILAKSLFNISYTNKDIEMAKTMADKNWITMVANLQFETTNPDVWNDFIQDLFTM